MRYIKSCGFIVYKSENNENYYLIIKSHNGDVGFPKGHMESGENELQTAIRELKEETGIDVDTIHDFRCQIEYPLPRVRDTMKQTVYFLGKCASDDIIIQETEVASAEFVTYDKAIEKLTFEETKNMLKKANDIINS
jgi:tRNA nucleotidyltransferase (CCA-adding enzyme)